MRSNRSPIRVPSGTPGTDALGTDLEGMRSAIEQVGADEAVPEWRTDWTKVQLVSKTSFFFLS